MTAATRPETLRTVHAARAAAQAAVDAEAAEQRAHRENGPDEEWETRNAEKWHAYETAAELEPGMPEMSEEAMLERFAEIAGSSDHALARRWKLPW
jgi:hypothetical protein